MKKRYFISYFYLDEHYKSGFGNVGYDCNNLNLKSVREKIKKKEEFKEVVIINFIELKNKEVTS